LLVFAFDFADARRSVNVGRGRFGVTGACVSFSLARPNGGLGGLPGGVTELGGVVAGGSLEVGGVPTESSGIVRALFTGCAGLPCLKKSISAPPSSGGVSGLARLRDDTGGRDDEIGILSEADVGLAGGDENPENGGDERSRGGWGIGGIGGGLSRNRFGVDV
jgi:hypothetical protein